MSRDAHPQTARPCGRGAWLSGWGPWRIARRELLPGLAAPVITYTALLVPSNITVEAALTVLGDGIRTAFDPAVADRRRAARRELTPA